MLTCWWITSDTFLKTVFFRLQWSFWGKIQPIEKLWCLSISDVERKIFSSRQKKFSRVVEIVFYKSRGTFCGKSFQEHFFWSSNIESNCFCFCCKSFQQAGQNSIPSVAMTTFVEIFFPKKLPFFIIVVNSGEIFGRPVEKFYL